MKKRIFSGLLALIMVLSCAPMPNVSAASDVYYELDTNGIDYGAEYLIVSSTNYALNGAGSPGDGTPVTVVNGNTIYSFPEEAECLWLYETGTNGLKNNNKYLTIAEKSAVAPSYEDNPFAVSIGNNSSAKMTDGKYVLYTKPSATSSFIYYLASSAAYTTIFASSYYMLSWASGLRLFKKMGGESVTTTYNITFNGNGNTAGTLPENKLGLEAGSSFTFPKPSDDFAKEVAGKTYLFWCWTENPDGSGTEYHPGDTIDVDRDIQFYAQWYLQTKHTVTVVTDLNDVPTDVEKILGEGAKLYVRLDREGSPLLPLEKVQEGVYSTTVTENGTYLVYAQHGDHQPEEEHGHKVIIYNQSGSTELLNYSVSYDANGGAFENAPETQNYHANTTVTATNEIPVLEGYRFLGWKDQKGNMIAPGEIVADKLLEKTVLTAQWEGFVNLVVNITVNHKPQTGGEDVDGDKALVSYLLMQEEGQAFLPYGEIQELDPDHESFDRQENGKTYYQVKYTGLPKGLYSIGTEKTDYEVQQTRTVQENGDQIIDLVYTYAPDNFDVTFDVQVNMGDLPETVRPQAVNMRVTYWSEELQIWQTITQHDNGATPVTVFIDENGFGSGFFSVWKEQTDKKPFYYRVRVSSFVMPDGTVVQANNTQENVVYVPEGSGLYTAKVTVDNGGQAQGTELTGAYYNGTTQVGKLLVTVEVTPYTVTFDAGDGLLNNQEKIVLENQYKYPDLRKYVPVPNEYDGKFFGWFVNGLEASNKAGQYLTGNITYVAEYNAHLTLQGTVYANGSYEQDGKPVIIADEDRVKNVMVILQKNINGVYNDVDSVITKISYNDLTGTGSYEFDHLVADGTQYRVYVQLHNYDVTYNNNGDQTFTYDEYDVVFDKNLAVVDLQLQMAPELYEQIFEVDIRRISEEFRPDRAEIQILYRDLGDTLPYQVIAQHKNDGNGIVMSFGENGKAAGIQGLWKWHNNATLYEYQLDLVTVYGNVDGIFTPEGTAYTDDLPFEVQYDMPAYYVSAENGEQPKLKATLIPKDYKIVFDMNLGNDPDTQILGMEKYLVDNKGEDQYAFYHTWSLSKNFEAFPYREGYVFLGWEENYDRVWVKDSGYVQIDAELAEEITLKAKWQKLEGAAYTVRHLELNTNKVLMGAQAITGVQMNASVKATKAVQAIEGYAYAGAMIGGVYYDKTEDPALTISDDPKSNLMVIYYRPDGSDGYTEQVEENIHLDKKAVLTNNGTYTITLETYTKNNPITTRIQQNTPLDIVLVLDQSGSIKTSNSLGDLQDSVSEFIELVAEHGREHVVDHRIAIVGYASDEDGGLTTDHPPAGALDGTKWVNTGVFDSNGDFHVYPITGFNYTPYTGTIEATGTYYTKSDGEYLLMTFHDIYRHLITEEEAKQSVLDGVAVYGYVGEDYVQLTRNTSGLWLYGDKQLYSETEFFTQHTNVWTHRHGTEAREIHAYMVDGKYVAEAGHEAVFVRTETQENGADKSIYEDALIPVTVSAGGAGSINPGLLKSTQHIGANGLTYVSYGMEMANRIFAANPQENGSVRIVVVFTDGKPGDSSNFDEIESNKAIAQSYIASSEHKARVYTVGVYGNDVVNAESDQDYFMNGLSSNYPNAQSLDDVWVGVTYRPATPGYPLEKSGPYFVEVNGNYYPLSREVKYENRNYYIIWGYDNAGTRVVVTRNLLINGHPIIDQNSQVTNAAGDKVTLYRRAGNGYKPAESKTYYTVAENTHVLKQYFADIVTSITTKITTQITLHDDTIMRDIMGQGLVLTPGTTITAYKQRGVFDGETNTVTWTGFNEEVASVVIPENPKNTLHSEALADISYELPDGTRVEKPKTPYISVYNLNSANPTDPNGENYHPHTIDVTGYDFTEWYISETKKEGYKMVVVIDRVEARDDVLWGRAQSTNNEQSGLWLPINESQERQLLLPFQQPSTIFVERAYVLDYGKTFTLADWYFDDEKADDGTVLQPATPIHLDCNVANGMNKFDTANKQNGKDNPYGNTRYGNVQVKDDGTVTYTPTSMNWGGYDQFLVFGETWRKTVLAQDANENGNLWNKVTVIPANNIYYEDSFITKPDSKQNGIEGFTFDGAWSTVTNGEVGKNVETPEHLEDENYGKVHGWTDSLKDDHKYTDGSAHVTGKNGEKGASVEFTFTGTGVDVYTRTNVNSGLVLAMLTSHTTDAQGNPVNKLVKSFIMENQAVSGDYYHIPTVSFDNLVYGSYTLKIIASASKDFEAGTERCEYYVDGVRIYNPLGTTQNYNQAVVKDAYEKELNAVYTEVRDILLQYEDFNRDMDDDTIGKEGAVFIDQIKEGQESGNDTAGEKAYTYEVGTFREYGPKNEVYLSSGQAIVLKVAEGNNYYVGLKSLTGETVTANISGKDKKAVPTSITLDHTADLYYQVTPIDGYIVIQNGGEDGILSITNLKTTNITAPAENGGVLPVERARILRFMRSFQVSANEPEEDNTTTQPETEEKVDSWQQVDTLFHTVRDWLREEDER